MKQFVVFFFSMLILLSCGESAKQKAEREAKEQAKKEKLAAEKAENERLDSLAEYAWGTLKFGISKEEARKHDMFSDAEESSWEGGQSSLAMSFHKRWELTQALGLEVIPDEFVLRFENDELHYINVTGKTFRYDDAKLLLRDCKFFTDNFSNKYSVVPVKYEEGLAPYNIEKDSKTMYSQFVIGSKGIIIYFGEDYNNRYYYDMSILNNNYPKNPYKKTEKERKEQEEKDRKVKEIRNESF